MILSADKYKNEDKLLKGKLKSYAAMELYLYALKKIIDIKIQLKQNPNKKLKHKKKRSGFKLFGGKKKQKNKEKTDNIEENVADHNLVNDKSVKHHKIDNNMVTKLNKISDKKLKYMQELYNNYSNWLTQNGQKCIDNKQIDKKQKELENKLGKDITNIITDSCLITNDLSRIKC
eukprot:181549_1